MQLCYIPLKNRWMEFLRTTGKKLRHAAAYRNNRKNELLAFNAVVNGKPELHPNGVYFLRYELNGKRV